MSGSVRDELLEGGEEAVNINKTNNTVRVFIVPDELPTGPVTVSFLVSFQMVDYFNALPEVELQGGEMDMDDESGKDVREDLKRYIRQRHYFRPERVFLALTGYGDAFYVTADN
jgi:hypothetical protein